MTGRVVDASGAAVPGAEVVVASRTGTLHRATTDLSGRFAIEFEPAAGAETLFVAAPGSCRQ